jgi:endonuclease/exonuclease/phosphatase family metal-dependent hydrolase
MDNILKVMTLNARHGRGTRRSPIIRRKTALENLIRISGVLIRENPDLVMLQEVDRKSVFTGYFDHVKKLAKLSNYEYIFHPGNHVNFSFRNVAIASYGTALVSKSSLEQPYSYRLNTNTPLKKGFVYAQTCPVQFNGEKIDIISLHLVALDPVPRKSRIRQASSIVNHILEMKSGNPIIMGGDFNCERNEEEALTYIARNLNLSYQREDEFCLNTFPSRKPRKCIDWIMVSHELEIKNYYCVSDLISDHYGVVAEISSRRFANS